MIYGTRNLCFERNYKDGCKNNKLVIKNGYKRKIIITAPHAVNHFRRNGSFKNADLWTGGMADLISQTTGLVSLVAGQRHPSMRLQPRQRPLVRALRASVQRSTKLVLDLHGCRNGLGFDFAIGTGLQKPSKHLEKLLNHFAVCCAQHGFALSINPEGYRATNPRSITNTAMSLGLCGLQIEVSLDCRNPRTSGNRVVDTVSCLSEILCSIE